MKENIDLLLAIDPSTDLVGFCFIRMDGSYVGSGRESMKKLDGLDCYLPSTSIPDTDKHGDAWDRLWRLSHFMSRRMSPFTSGLARHSIAVVAIEESAGFHGNLATERKMGAAMGVVLAVAAQNNVGVIRIKPTEVKATGCSKKDALSMRAAAAFAGKESVSKDEADAIGVALAAVAKLKERKWSTNMK